MRARLRLHPLVFLALAAMCAQCGAPSPGTNSGRDSAASPADMVVTGPPVRGDWLVERTNAEPAMMSPILALTDGTGRYISAFIYETLFKLDNDTLEPVPHIAKSWDISDDRLTYTFYLRDDVTFSDGVRLTAHDAKFTMDMIVNPDNDTGPIRSYLNDIESVEVIGDYTIRFQMKRPYFGHLVTLGLLDVMPKHLHQGDELNTSKYNRAPVGSGPYVFGGWETGQRITLLRNENYWGEAPPLDKRVYTIITDDNASLQVLQRHEVDMMDFQGEMWNTHASKPAFVADFKKYTPDSPVPGYLSRYNYIGWNMRKPQFSDKRVRQALTMLFDRQLIIDEVWGGLGTIITGDAYHKMPEYNSDIEPWPFDPERAKKLLAEAGWIDRDRDGVREKNGVPFVFELAFSANVAEYDQLGTVYQEELKRAGIKVNLNPLEWASFQERLHKRTFDASMLAWLTTSQHDPYQLWHSSQAKAGSNYPGFVNAEADALIEKARLEFDRDKRIKLYHRFQEILHEEQPYIFLYARPGLIAVDKRFQVTSHTAGIDPMEWWVPKTMQMYPR